MAMLATLFAQLVKTNYPRGLVTRANSETRHILARRLGKHATAIKEETWEIIVSPAKRLLLLGLLRGGRGWRRWLRVVGLNSSLLHSSFSEFLGLCSHQFADRVRGERFSIGWRCQARVVLRRQWQWL